MASGARTKIVGDVASTADVRIDRGTGNSVSVDLKRTLVEHLRVQDKVLAGAALDFGRGYSAVILSSDMRGDPMVVRRLGQCSFNVSFGDTGQAEIEVGEIEAAFLRLKSAEFVKGELDLLPPVSGRDYARSIERKLGDFKLPNEMLAAQSDG